MAFNTPKEIEDLLMATARDCLVKHHSCTLDEPIFFFDGIEEIELCLAVEQAFKVDIPDDDAETFSSLRHYYTWLVKELLAPLTVSQNAVTDVD